MISLRHPEHYWELNKCYVRGLILLQKAGFFGKDSNAEKDRRQQEKKKIKYEVD